MRSEQFLLKLNDEIQSGQAVEIPKGSNKGPRVSLYLTTAGASPGNPWCASFLYYCALQTKLYEKKDLPSHPASVYGWKTFFDAKGRIFSDASKVKRGDIGFWLDADNQGHIFAINELQHQEDGWYIRTSEGNTNTNGSREGWEACKKWRKCTPNIHFIKFSDY